jgi:HK97 family phage portal protein
MSTRSPLRSVRVPYRFRHRPPPRPSRARHFFAPTYTTIAGFVRSTFRAVAGLWGQSVGPVNSTSSHGGIEITPQGMLTVGSVWACSWRYANTISTLPLQLKRVGPQNSAALETMHPLYSILHDAPNSQMSAASFWQAMVMSEMLWGAGYARKLKVGDRLVGLRPLRPEWITTYLAVDGTVRWIYRPAGGAPAEDLGSDDLFVVMDRTVDGYAPCSRIEYARHSLGLAIAADRAAGVSWRNGLRATGVLLVDKVLKSEQREQYQENLARFQGTGLGDSSDRQGGIMVAEAATKFEALNLKNADLELLGSRKFSIEDVCRWYDLPPVLVGHASEGQTMWGSGIEQIVLGWLKFGLGPLLVKHEREIYRQLLTPAERATLFAEFNLEALLRGDSQARASFISTMLQNGVYNRNYVRSFESLPPYEGGEVYTVQSNLTPVDRLGQDPAGSVGEVQASIRRLLGIEEAQPPPSRQGDKS